MAAVLLVGNGAYAAYVLFGIQVSRDGSIVSDNAIAVPIYCCVGGPRMTRTVSVSIAEKVRVAGSETEWDSLVQAFFIQDTGHAIADRHGWQDLRRIVETSVHWNELARS